MKGINFDNITKTIKGQRVDRPNRASAGTLSGHAAGEPFEKCVLNILKKKYKGKIFKQYEFLNDLFLKNPKHITKEDKYALIDSPTAQFLLSRGDSATSKWAPDNLFEERQNDTADILYFESGFYNIIDVKTRNLEKTAQPPNIISAYKLAQMCAYMIENKEYNSICIDYIGVDWREDKSAGKLVCEDAQHVCLFKVKPSELYINWAAALQIQFHPHNVDQSWEGSIEEWARGYLRHFVDSAQQRCDKMRKKFIKPFLKYTK
ncbi:MAG: HincII family type II restriction endonuclease [Prevotella sp.]|nr:HincII family type II restriction endonuclease [Prevotella sp.]